MLRKKLAHLLKGDDIHPIIQIRMNSPWYNQQLFIVPPQILIRILAEIAGMGLFTMNQQDSAADFTAVLQNRHIQKRQRRGDIPAII